MKKILLILLLTLPTFWFLLKPGFFPTDDGEWMVVRLTDFHRSFASGQLPVRWAARLNYSYGYPVFNFLYPLSLYWGEFFHLLGFSFVWSIKLVFICSFLISAFFMYLWAKELWGKWGGLVSAVFYIYAPYRFLDVYVRGSLGEAVAFIFLPLIFWSIYKISQKQKKIYLVVGALALATLILSHNIMAMIFMPIILVYAFWQILIKKNSKLITYYLLLITLSLALSCFFWLPAIYDQRFIIRNQVTVANPTDHFPSLKQLLVPAWGYGPSIPGAADKASYQIGLVHLLAVGAVIFSLNAQTGFFLLTFLVGVFFMLPFSAFFWKNLSIMNLIQFPWRLLAITTFSSGVLAGSLIAGATHKLKILLLMILLTVVVLFNFRYARPETLIDRGEGFYATNEATTTVKDEYLPIWVKEKPLQRATAKIELIRGKGEIKNLFVNSKKTSFLIEAAADSEIQVNTVYFPGWQAQIDEKPAGIDYQNKQGLIRLKIPSGSHQALIEFKETPIRLLADIISLGSILVIVFILVLK